MLYKLTDLKIYYKAAVKRTVWLKATKLLEHNKEEKT